MTCDHDLQPHVCNMDNHKRDGMGIGIGTGMGTTQHPRSSAPACVTFGGFKAEQQRRGRQRVDSAVCVSAHASTSWIALHLAQGPNRLLDEHTLPSSSISPSSIPLLSLFSLPLPLSLPPSRVQSLGASVPNLAATTCCVSIPRNRLVASGHPLVQVESSNPFPLPLSSLARARAPTTMARKTKAVKRSRTGEQGKGNCMRAWSPWGSVTGQRRRGTVGSK